MPNLYIIAGCNGEGKTTASLTVLPDVLNCFEFINADNIAKGLSPFNVEGVAIEAAKIMLNRIEELITKGVDFAIETTLASKTYAALIKRVKLLGYEVHLIFFWLNTVDLAIERVKQRVLNGGHNMPLDIIKRRYKNGLKNLNLIYASIVDSWTIYDNSNNFPLQIAKKFNNDELIVNNTNIFNIITNEK
ncbi:MAG: zeta toxin family protein [Bacteroidetes bacterium]|nr:zeta toxin family protein [Bacteroidota bacterium]